jgi:hypothetical protein
MEQDHQQIPIVYDFKINNNNNNNNNNRRIHTNTNTNVFFDNQNNRIRNYSDTDSSYLPGILISTHPILFYFFVTFSPTHDLFPFFGQIKLDNIS